MAPQFVIECMCISLLLLIMFRLYITSRRRHEGKGSPNGSMGWPVLGETLSFLIDLDSFTRRSRVKHGKVYKTSLFGFPTIISLDPEFNKHALLCAKLIPGYPQCTFDMLGEWSLVCRNDDMHDRMRGWILSYIQSNIDGHLLRMTDDVTSSCLENLDGKVVSLQQKLQQITMYNMLAMITSLKEGPLLHELSREFDIHTDGLFCLKVNLPFSTYRNGLKAREKLINLLGELIRERRRSLQEKDLHNDLLSWVINAETEGHIEMQLTTEQVIDFLLAAVTGGYQTTFGTILMGMKFLHHYPKVLAELRSEHLAINARKLERNQKGLSWEDYKSMSFTTKVIFEIMRLASTVPGIFRKCIGDVEIKGYKVPKNWRLLLYLKASNDDENTYVDSFMFNPWRQECSDFLPFGGGRRLCPGRKFALLEVAIFLHHLVIRYDWKEIYENEKIKDIPRLRTAKGFPVKFHYFNK